MEKFVEKLLDNNVGILKENEPLSKHTTIKIGGPARVFVEPNGIDKLLTTVKIAKELGVNFRVIGRGSNLLVADTGFDGLIIKMTRGMDKLEIDGEKIKVGAGHSIVTLATSAAKNGLSGLEFASGIPGSIGGAVYMNAGAHGSDISKILTKAHILFANGEDKWLSLDEMGYSYRTSVLQKINPGIVLECELKLEKGVQEEIKEKTVANKEYRMGTQPYHMPNAGSFFRNPLPLFAGKLIEDLSLKGYKIGGAQVSEMHGNFIVNAGGASAQDVLDLIAHIKTLVKEKYDVELHTEIEYLG